MNRIILVGNGFDLAHGLKTSYGSFIEWVCSSFIKNAANSEDLYFENKVFKISCHQPKPSGNPVNSLKDAFLIYTNVNGLKGEELTLNDIKKMRGDEWLRDIMVSIKWEEKNLLFSDLLERRTTSNWVDIEEIYYKKLKEAAKISSEEQRLETIDKLNRDLDIIKELLNEYLLLEENRSSQQIEAIDNYLSASCSIFDFVDKGIVHERVEHFIRTFKGLNRIDLRGPNHINYSVLDDFYPKLQSYLSKYSYWKNVDHISNWQQWKEFLETEVLEIINELGLKNSRFKDIFDCLLAPNNVLFLNFNYTTTTKKYAETKVSIEGKNHIFETNHIHGTLNTENNIENMIFGYGDELSSNYKELEDLNENGVLENVKSIRYLDTNNYSNLIRFMDSDKYQIYIMGHSCGISDRTLLNTLFEHDNCVSIKPFYYQWVDNNGNQRDNYREIVQNISRNFGDKVMMRSKVVNKEYCQPLPQLETK